MRILHCVNRSAAPRSGAMQVSGSRFLGVAAILDWFRLGIAITAGPIRRGNHRIQRIEARSIERGGIDKCGDRIGAGKR
jgi:hypothetical protein